MRPLALKWSLPRRQRSSRLLARSFPLRPPSTDCGASSIATAGAASSTSASPGLSSFASSSQTSRDAIEARGPRLCRSRRILDPRCSVRGGRRGLSRGAGPEEGALPSGPPRDGPAGQPASATSSSGPSRMAVGRSSSFFGTTRRSHRGGVRRSDGGAGVGRHLNTTRKPLWGFGPSVAAAIPSTPRGRDRQRLRPNHGPCAFTAFTDLNGEENGTCSPTGLDCCAVDCAGVRPSLHLHRSAAAVSPSSSSESRPPPLHWNGPGRRREARPRR